LNRANRIQIAGKEISETNAFVIAEVGSNHGQKLENALEYIKVASDCGVDAVKFQYFYADDIVPRDHPARAEVERYVTPKEWIPTLQDYCDKVGVTFFASAFNLELFGILDKSGVPLHKIASSEVLNMSMLLAAGRSMKPILISFGMSEWYEVEVALKVLSETKNELIIPMHCISEYPLAVPSSNLKIITELSRRYRGIVGFSDHTESTEIGGWAAMLGARVFEKHITLNKKESGADHSYALEPSEFDVYVKGIRMSIEALGSGEKKYLGAELEGRRRYGLRAGENVAIGTSLKNLKVEKVRPRTQVPSNLIGFIQDLRTKSETQIGEELLWENLE